MRVFSVVLLLLRLQPGSSSEQKFQRAELYLDNCFPSKGGCRAISEAGREVEERLHLLTARMGNIVTASFSILQIQ